MKKRVRPASDSGEFAASGQPITTQRAWPGRGGQHQTDRSPPDLCAPRVARRADSLGRPQVRAVSPRRIARPVPVRESQPRPCSRRHPRIPGCVPGDGTPRMPATVRDFRRRRRTPRRPRWRGRTPRRQDGDDARFGSGDRARHHPGRTRDRDSRWQPGGLRPRPRRGPGDPGRARAVPAGGRYQRGGRRCLGGQSSATPMRCTPRATGTGSGCRAWTSPVSRRRAGSCGRERR